MRRLKTDVLKQLAAKIDTVLLLPLEEGRQSDVYQNRIKDYKLRKQQKLASSEIKHIFTELRKAANHPLLVKDYFGNVVDGIDRTIPVVLELLLSVHAFGPGATKRMILQEIAGYSDWDFHLLACEFGSSCGALNRMVLPKEALWNSSKCRELRKILPDLKANGRRACLFSQWTTILDILEEVMKELGIRYVRFDGSTSIGDRQDIVDNFYATPEITVFLLSTRAGGLGINLTCADTVIIHDLDFNPTIDRQGKD